MKRTLSLKRERLTELSNTDLAGVVGGGELTPIIQSVPLDECLAPTWKNCCTASASC